MAFFCEKNLKSVFPLSSAKISRTGLFTESFFFLKSFAMKYLFLDKDFRT